MSKHGLLLNTHSGNWGLVTPEGEPMGAISLYLFNPNDCDGDIFLHVAVVGYWLNTSEGEVIEPDLYEFMGADAERVCAYLCERGAHDLAFLEMVADVIWADAPFEEPDATPEGDHPRSKENVLR